MGKHFVKTLAEKFARLKHKEIIIAVIAVAVMLIIYFSSMGGSSAANEEETRADYCAKMETEVKDAVRVLSGDKNANVIINWESGIEAVIAYTVSTNKDSSVSTPVVGTGSKPIVLKEVYPKALGVAVVVKGGGAVKTKLDIMNMVSVLLDISPEKIAVYAKK